MFFLNHSLLVKVFYVCNYYFFFGSECIKCDRQEEIIDIKRHLAQQLENKSYFWTGAQFCLTYIKSCINLENKASSIQMRKQANYEIFVLFMTFRKLCSLTENIYSNYKSCFAKKCRH